MKKFKTNNNKLLITSSSALSSIILVTTFTSCNVEKINNSDSSIDQSSNQITSSDVIIDTTTESTTETEVYNFIWEYNDTLEFEKYIQKRFNTSIQYYIVNLGITKEFEQAFTDFNNSKRGENFRNVPISKANYFYDYICPDVKRHQKRDEFDYFKSTQLNKDRAYTGTFANKLIMSYLVQNNIPFGTRVPLENLKALMGDQVYNYDMGNEIILNNQKLGNYNAKYSEAELFVLLRRYNFSIYYMCEDYQIKSGNPLDNVEVFIKINDHLKKVYGENAPQIGQKITPEDYEKIWGEPVMDISYIQGSVVQVPQETLASPISYIDYDNYTVYYNPNYNMYEEETGRSR